MNGKAKSFGNRPAEGVNRVMDGLRDWGGVENRPVPGEEDTQGAERNRRLAFREVRARRRGRGLAVRREALAGEGAFLRGRSHPLLRVREVSGVPPGIAKHGPVFVPSSLRE